ncbi:MarR family winged helix-turn-helix transcriptional regulator [Roseateles sp.]|uniref:MarR family winged helix-turn-helix transcriptional regulator n=1 Tax=Roseateles sp. TaxID=1971397 RepID=UPI0025DABD32|nr:MarR family transcriptional regulator [Roseateles sp.]MBV8035207.1 MarR family transcriptional regulator [Roseateles sp.]
MVSRTGSRQEAERRFPTLDDKLCFALYSSSLAMLQSYKRDLGDLGLTYPQYLVMLVLWEGDGVTIKHVAERLGLDSGSVTPLVKRLGEAGFLVRRRDAADERNLSIELTPEGRALQERAERASSQFVSACKLPLAEGGELRDTLARLARTLRGAD